MKKLKELLKKEPPITTLLIGSKFSGKTTLLKYLKYKEFLPCMQTIKYNVEKIKHNKLKLEVWDLSGESCDLWLLHSPLKNLILYVIDGSLRTFELERKQLDLVVQKWKEDRVPILFLISYQDRKCASILDITNALNLEDIDKEYWEIEPICAPEGEGIDKIWEFIESKFKKKK